MDYRTVARFIAEVEKVLPPDVKEEIAKHIDKATEALMDFGTAMDEAAAQSSKANWSDVVDNHEKSGDGNEAFDPTFEDIVNGWDADGSAVTQTPGAESAGSEDVSVDSITRDIYRFMTKNNKGYVSHNAVHEEWNVNHPLHLVIDYLQYLSDEELSKPSEI